MLSLASLLHEPAAFEAAASFLLGRGEDYNCACITSPLRSRELPLYYTNIIPGIYGDMSLCIYGRMSIIWGWILL